MAGLVDLVDLVERGEIGAEPTVRYAHLGDSLR